MLTFVTHPDVVISKNLPAPRWPLSERGRARMHQGLRLPWVKQVQAEVRAPCACRSAPTVLRFSGSGFPCAV